ncbi:MAG: hypothetical protein KDA96_16980 [Planctomycetaceae bacterium]|nr:hypothetical protein [Planctomycetaceae bacterium]
MRLLITTAAAFVFSLPASIAQDTDHTQGLRVSTHIYDVEHAASDGRAPVLSASLSLFHNGRVYDSVESAEEILIFDPSERRFVILNMARELITTVQFEEMNHLLESHRPTAEQYIRELTSSNGPGATRVAESLRFQLEPRFHQKFDAASGHLVLSAPLWTYRVETRPWEDTSQLQTYLTYADWTARLNYIMRPNSLFPEPRLELNRVLREHKNRMPVVVELDLTPGEALRLRAEHRFTLGLSDDDHRRVSRWDDIVRNNTFRKLSFRSYQETVLISQAR